MEILLVSSGLSAKYTTIEKADTAWDTEDGR